MENRPTGFPSSFKKIQNRPNSLSFGTEESQRNENITLVSPQSSPWLNARASFMTPLSEFNHIQSPVTTPGGSLKRKAHLTDLYVTKDVSREFQKVKFDPNVKPKEEDEWNTVSSPEFPDQQWDDTVPPPTSSNCDDEEMGNNENNENNGFGIFPGPCTAAGGSSKWGSPMSISSPMTPMSSRFFYGSRPGTPTDVPLRGLRRRTPSGTPIPSAASTVCDKSILGFPSFPVGQEYYVQECWE